MPAESSLSARAGSLSISLLLWLGLYFLINRREVHPARRRNWSTFVDRKIPFCPQFTLIYLSTFAFGLLPFFMISATHLFQRMVYGYAFLTAMGSLVHIGFPSQVDRVENFPGGSLSTRMLSWYQKIARPYDNFPSLHVAYAVIVVGAGFSRGGAELGVVFLIWAFLIAVSTLYTKQHYLPDVLAGGGLGLLTWMLIRYGG